MKLDFCNLKLDADLLMQSVALLGNKGGGKTIAGKKLFEAGYDAGVQCIALVPVGKWWSLRLGANGKSAGGLADVYIFGGQHADFPLQPDKGAFIAKILVEKKIHAVLDVSMMRKGERRRFLADFAEEFWLLKKRDEGAVSPSVLFLEEAHALIPQKPMPDEARMLGAFEDIVREGRNYGVGVVVMDQRPATVNKNVLALTEVLLVFRTTWATDRKVYKEWTNEKGIGGPVEAKELDEMLPALPAGEGYLWIPGTNLGEVIKVKMIRTFDATATFKLGQKAQKVGQLAKADVEALAEAMKPVVEVEQGKDPKWLAGKVRQLEQELLRVRKQPVVREMGAPEIKIKEVKVIEYRVPNLRGLKRAADLATKAAESFVAEVKALEKVAPEKAAPTVTAVDAPIRRPAAVMGAARGDRQVIARDHEALASAVARFVDTGDVSTPQLVGKSRDMLAVLQAYRHMELKRLATYVSMKTGGGFYNYVGALVKLGYAVREHGNLVVTAAGEQVQGLESIPLPKTLEDVVKIWEHKLVGKSKDMLQRVVDSGDSGVDLKELATAVGMQPGGGFYNYVGALVTAGLCERRRGRLVVRTDLVAA